LVEKGRARPADWRRQVPVRNVTVALDDEGFRGEPLRPPDSHGGIGGSQEAGTTRQTIRR